MFSWFKKKSSKVDRNTDNLKVSVIMPVYLGEYEGAASDREEKFKRAVISFTRQTYENKELIIVSDGCEIAERIYKDCLIYENVIFKKIPKQPLFSGNVRYEAQLNLSGDIICYLDSDDMLGFTHLQTIANSFQSNKDVAWLYYNDLILPPKGDPIMRDVSVEHGSIGTSSIAHWRFLPHANWKGCNGYGHDWQFIEKLRKHNPNFKKILGAEYYVCHIPKMYER